MKCIHVNRNARPNNNQLNTHYEHVSYLLRIDVDNTYNMMMLNKSIIQCCWVGVTISASKLRSGHIVRFESRIGNSWIELRAMLISKWA